MDGGFLQKSRRAIPESWKQERRQSSRLRTGRAVGSLCMIVGPKTFVYMIHQELLEGEQDPEEQRNRICHRQHLRNSIISRINFRRKT